ncbi:Nramp family divalent metal transporter [Propionimicrobium sp. PCR01-08-3]|uniref:Nramp family divalent metal transporter n=1 Tax=Propionimicrobium sp. PCR01-08-3 TaxID=3052086 RepID=UPI00255C3D23|nr:Nramp family divalent metal transporter [Propionimicrobium sp. PCR01-08-3]WIY83756.1 Nramp family divalent metal transporter [Propionimicrobium sp. PCR01-08-3]
MSTGVETTPALEPLRYPEQDPKLASKKFLDLLSIVGPGFILASVTIGNGEIFQATRGGAVFGYTILWTFIFGAIFKAVVVYAAARYMVITGEHPFARMGHVIPGFTKSGVGRHWLATFFGVLAAVCFPAWCVAYILALSQWTPWVITGSQEPWLWAGIAWSLIAYITLWVKDFSKVENLQTAIVGLLIVFSIIALIVANPNWGHVLQGLFVPEVPSEYPGWVQEKFPDVAAKAIPVEILSYLGALGGGIYDYIGYIGTFREKDWGMLGRADNTEINLQLQALGKDEQIPIAMDDENLERCATGVKAAKIDSVTSFIAVGIFAVTFMVLGTVVLGADGAQQVPADNNILTEQAAFFTNVHPILKYLYMVAIWCAFWGSQQALLTVTYPYTVREAFSPAFPVLNNPKHWQKLRIIVATYTLGIAIILALTGASYTAVIGFAGILGGVFALGLWGFCLLRAEYKVLPKQLRMKPLIQVILVIASIAMTVMGIVGLIGFFS